MGENESIDCPWCETPVYKDECWQGGLIYTCPACGAPLTDEFDLAEWEGFHE